MLYSNIAVAEKYNYLDEKFLKAYSWLRETDLEKIAPGRYDIQGDDIYASVQEYETVPEEDKKFESHKRYFDVQYVVRGQEKFGICRTEGLTSAEAHDDRDLYFYEEPAECGYLVLGPGDMAVVAPEDAHKPGCSLNKDKAESVRKIVIKVAV